MSRKRWRRNPSGRLMSCFKCSSEEEEEIDQNNRQNQTVDQCEINQTPPGTIRFGVLNTRSMVKKTDQIKELITENNLDALLTTETWLNDNNADRLLSKASPEGFRFHHQVRTDGRRGGGVANQFSKELQRELKSSDSSDKKIKTKTFDSVDTKLQADDWDKPLGVYTVYRPPDRDKKEFQIEFKSLVKKVSKDSSIIMAGDFNIPVNEKRRSYTDEFDSLLRDNNFTQHVKEPTHKAGNTLDLVITRNVEISDLSVRDDKISDHSTVYFSAKPKDTGKKTYEKGDQEQEWFRKTEE